MKCSYCSEEIEPGTGIMFVRKNGSIRYYCSNRCYKLEVLYKKRQSSEKHAHNAKSTGIGMGSNAAAIPAKT
ncbi:MAG: hypothetical protein QW091_01535 [Candidatus Micrarchaeaceae archaeon]